MSMYEIQPSRSFGEGHPRFGIVVQVFLRSRILYGLFAFGV